MKTTLRITAFSLPLAACMLSFHPLLAQHESKINPKVEVQRDYEGRIMEITKPKLSPFIPDSISQFNLTMDYAIFDKPYYDLYSFTPLPSVHLSSPKTLKQPWASIRLGTAWQVSPEADIFIQAPLSGESALLLTGQHRSFWGELPRYRQVGKTVADQMQNRADLRYSLNWEKGRLELGGSYNYNYYTYYGVAPILPESFLPAHLNSRTFMRDSMSHAYNLFQADLSLSSFRSAQSDVEWSFTAGWSLIEDRARMWNITGTPTSRENLIQFKGRVSIPFTSEQKFGIALRGSFSNNLSSSELDRGVFAFNPYYLLAQDRLSLHLGLVLSGALNYVEESEKTNKFFFYPQLKASYQIIPNNLLVYADAFGETVLNTFQSLMAENPWLSQSLYLRSSDIKWNIRAGLKGKTAHHFGFNFYGEYVRTNNQHFFTNTFYLANLHRNAQYLIFLNNLFDLYYADEERFSAVAELSWNTTPLTLHLTGKYHSYTLSTGLPAWNKPKIEANVAARYQWRERIIASANVAYRGKVFASPIKDCNYYLGTLSSSFPVQIESSTKIDGFVDIGLMLEYRFASWFGVYVEGKNLLNANKQYYLLYQEPGVRIGGGITFRF